MHSRQKLWSQPSGEPTACDVSRARHIGQRGQASSTSPSLSDSNSSLKATVPLPSVFTSHELLASVSLAVSDPINTQSKCIRIINSMHSERILTSWNTLWLLFSFFFTFISYYQHIQSGRRKHHVFCLSTRLHPFVVFVTELVNMFRKWMNWFRHKLA